MRQLDLLQPEFAVPQSLLEAVSSPYFGADGGNVESPIWFCALEPGKGYTKEKPCLPQSFYGLYDEEKLYLKAPSSHETINEALIRSDGTSIVSGSPVVHQVFVLLLTAMITGRLECKHLFGRRVEEACIDLLKDYEYFQKNRHGLILNAYPISMAKHVQGGPDWKTNHCIKDSENSSELLTLAQWTSIPKLKSYLKWCASVRHNCHSFTNIRRKFKPAIVYCGGRTDRDNFFRMWIDSEDEKLLKKTGTECKKFSITSPTRTADLNFEYVWLENGKGASPTLLVVGPFFGPYQASCLTEPITCELLATKLRKLLTEKFSGEELTKRFNKFLPTSKKIPCSDQLQKQDAVTD